MIEDYNDKERKTDRILVLRQMDGLKAKSSTGLDDPRLFTGKNNLHVVMDGQNCLWNFKMDHGGLPELLKQTFTTFAKAKQHAEQYYKARNIIITEVIE